MKTCKLKEVTPVSEGPSEQDIAQVELKELLSVVMIFIVIGIASAYGLDVTADVRDDMTANSAEYNATQDAISGVGKITSKLPTIGTVVGAAVILTILVRYLYMRFVA